ncbi:glutaredoxin family protein [Domibacillus indicus]|uniref:glutaredoxin family protein n=1 Tax=Domibacillus indicus TaxID=1437523 RepID=UPI00061823B6|nr:glutaredoxin family protein [Domibacillus indicus]
MKVYFYTRQGCHLCEDAWLIVNIAAEELGLVVMERNIEEKDEWMEEYGLMIPVVEASGEVIAYGQVDYAALFTKLKEKLTNNLKK